MRQLHVSTRSVLLVSLVLVASSTGLALSQSRAEEQPRARPLAGENVQSTQKALASEFAVLRRPAGEDDRLPDLARGVVGRSGVTLGGANPDLARLVSAEGHMTMYAVPGDGALCLVLYSPDAGSGRSCVPTGVATQHGIWMSTAAAGDPTARSVYGLAPDWVEEVQFSESSSDSAHVVEVKTNGYIATVSDGGERATLAGSGRSAPSEVPMR